jgi:mannose-1-phosphate guanylyltransferase
LLQKALHRAIRVASASRVLVTARDDYRQEWEPSLWFIKAAHRIVTNAREGSWLTTAAALLRIEQKAPEAVVVILPARCFVAHEERLSEALEEALAILPQIPEGALTLGMIDLDEGMHEDYLVPTRGQAQWAQPLLAVARQPVPWIADHLRARGALVASGIIVARVRVLTAHISRVVPGLTIKLIGLNAASDAAAGETRVGANLRQGVPNPILRTFRWYPPGLPQRALRVYHCGWSGLRSARAVARVFASVPTNSSEAFRRRSMAAGAYDNSRPGTSAGG